LDPIVGLGDLLCRHVVGHQRIDDGGNTEACDGESPGAVQEIAAIDLAVNVAVVKLDRLTGKLGSFWRHVRLRFEREDTTAPHVNARALERSSQRRST